MNLRNPYILLLLTVVITALLVFAAKREAKECKDSGGLYFKGNCL